MGRGQNTVGEIIGKCFVCKFRVGRKICKLVVKVTEWVNNTHVKIKVVGIQNGKEIPEAVQSSMIVMAGCLKKEVLVEPE